MARSDPPSASDLFLEALEALGQATPVQIHEWVSETHPEAVQQRAAYRAAARRLERKGRVRALEDKDGVYRIVTAQERAAASSASLPGHDPPRPGYRTEQEYWAERGGPPAPVGPHLVTLAYGGQPYVAWDLNAGAWVRVGPGPVVDVDAALGIASLPASS